MRGDGRGQSTWAGASCAVTSVQCPRPVCTGQVSSEARVQRTAAVKAGHLAQYQRSSGSPVPEPDVSRLGGQCTWAGHLRGHQRAVPPGIPPPGHPPPPRSARRRSLCPLPRASLYQRGMPSGHPAFLGTSLMQVVETSWSTSWPASRSSGQLPNHRAVTNPAHT